MYQRVKDYRSSRYKDIDLTWNYKYQTYSFKLQGYLLITIAIDCQKDSEIDLSKR